MTQKVQLDTSVLIAGVIASHPNHSECSKWLKKGLSNEVQIIVSGHSIAEVYSVLTRMPSSPKITNLDAIKIIEQGILPCVNVENLSGDELINGIKRLAIMGIKGGTVYDGLIAEVGRLHRVEYLITSNTKHFELVWPERNRIINP